MFAILFWFTSLVLAVGGTFYWFIVARHRADRHPELLGLILAWVLFALTTALIVGAVWLVIYLFRDFHA